jgi:hypothetical protein
MAQVDRGRPERGAGRGGVAPRLRFQEERACRAANQKTCVWVAGQLGPGSPVLAPPFRPATRIVPRPSAPVRHQPGRSSGRLWRNKAPPAHEDALGQTSPFHSLSKGRRAPDVQRRVRLPCPDVGQHPGLCTVPHNQKKQGVRWDLKPRGQTADFLGLMTLPSATAPTFHSEASILAGDGGSWVHGCGCTPAGDGATKLPVRRANGYCAD